MLKFQYDHDTNPNVLVQGKPVGYLQGVVNLSLEPRATPLSSPSWGCEPIQSNTIYTIN